MTVLPEGCYPAAVTPFDAEGLVDEASVARLLAYFEAAGCQGVVLAGTNGEGPSLSAYEKRDLLRVANRCRGRLKLVLGIATASLSEAQWLCRQAAQSDADAVLVMPPGYFRNVTDEGIERWFGALLDSSLVPVLAYNYPKLTGVTLSASTLQALAGHPNLAGVKDSSGERANLTAYREVLGDRHCLFVGDETLLTEALRARWTGTISGAANLLPRWLTRIVAERSETLFEVALPVIQAIRRSPQPATNKSVLHALGVVSRPDPRLPLLPVEPGEVLDVLGSRLGIRPGELGLDPS